ncbi:hypothetical protein [Alkalibacillus haloalkaliphilus]|uniref:hypothetical protein n=1 Tax=Alkalibacillus haloalkaliphilus TaxID=94136 RepID=UPI0002D78A0E|nr:hypothetical protein [Alkalibacillus haloalkaliphilus]
MKLLLILLVLVFSGCDHYDEEKLVQEHQPATPMFDYNLTIVVSDEHQISKINNSVVSEFGQMDLKRVMTTSYVWDDQNISYTNVFDIDEYPTFLLFGHEGVVLKTSDLTEVRRYLN